MRQCPRLTELIGPIHQLVARSAGASAAPAPPGPRMQSEAVPHWEGRNVNALAEAHDTEHWLGRTVNADDAKFIVQYAFSLLPDDKRRSFLDIGCGPGTILKLVHDNEWATGTIGGIEFDAAMAAEARLIAPSGIIEANLLRFSAAHRVMLRRLTGTPTVAYCYDGGVFPIDVLHSIIQLLADNLPAGSIIVFVTANTGGGEYDAQKLADEVAASSNFHLIHAEHDIREDVDPTMQALYFGEGERHDDALNPVIQTE